MCVWTLADRRHTTSFGRGAFSETGFWRASSQGYETREAAGVGQGRSSDVLAMVGLMGVPRTAGPCLLVRGTSRMTILDGVPKIVGRFWAFLPPIFSIKAWQRSSKGSPSRHEQNQEAKVPFFEHLTMA